MFCLYCKNYIDLNSPCRKDKNVLNFQEVVDCKDYEYNGECNDNL